MATAKIYSKHERENSVHHWVWFCDNCYIHGGMSTTNNPQCPGCQHYRCEFCPLEAVLERKVEEKPRKSRAPRHSRPPSPSTLPVMSLTLLQKVPTQHLALNVSQEDVKTPAALSHTGALGTILSPRDYTTSAVESKCIALSDISPPTSPPGLSPSPTETSLYSSDSSNSEMTSPNITDLGSDVTTPTGEGEYDDSFTEDESESPTTLLDSRLFMVLGHDLELAARLIPRIHALIQYSFASEDSAVRVVPSQGPGETTQTSPSSVGGNAVTASSSVKRTDLQHRKHKRISDEEDEARRNGGPKRPRKKFGPNSPRPPGFACPFFKKDPEKYAAGIDRKYRTCSGPRSHELRRIKDHFRLTHRPPQCERCYQIFEDVTQLTEHRRSEPPCSQNGIELKEGIDDGQWEMIEGVLRKSRNEPVRERKHEIDIWFEIWDILFPDTPRPISPWSDSAQARPVPMTLHVDNLMNTLDVVIELDIERGNLQRNDHVHERYRLAVRQVLETAMAVSPQASAHSPLPPLNFNSDSGGLQEFSPGNGPSANQLLPPSLSSHSIGESPTRYPRGYGIQDATLQSWVSPQSQIDNSTPSVSTQNSMATQWGTPQQLSTPATSTSLDTMGELRDQSTGNSNLHSETPGYALDETLGLPLQTESSEEWEEWRNFASGADISQQSGVEIGVPQLDFGRPRPNEPLLPEDDLGRWQDASDIFANNESLTAILESEIQLPTAGAPIKDHRDRNKGLQAPLYED